MTMRNTKQTEQDNPCLWFLFYFTSLSTRTWPLHYCLRHGVFHIFLLVQEVQKAIKKY